MRRFKTLYAAWERFWFESDGREQIRAFRLGLGLLLLICYLIRSMDLALFFGEKGMMPLAILSDVSPMDYRWSILSWSKSVVFLWACNLIFLASLLGVAFLPRPRVAVLIAWALHVSFIHRNLAIAYGVDMIACFFLFFLCFADFRAGTGRGYKAGDLRATLGSMSFRLSQIQVCIIYGYSGLKKLKGYSWWSGEAIWHSLGQTQLARWDFSWAAHFPLAIALMTYTTLAWEIYFPALVWIRPVRKPLLAVGVFLHMGIALGINLPFFAFLMMLTYLFFLDSSELARVRGRVAKKFAVLV